MSDSHSAQAKQYWKENIRTVLLLLSVWFTASFILGILLVDELNTIRFFGFKLGFWVAQQGAIYVFVALIFIYVSAMNKLDHKYQVDEDQDDYVPDEDYYHIEESKAE
ncbi:MAG: hypothetical protein CMF31_05705 [Kordiimonas sp.]|nr:hypothetical protein [Kordiimonas sp.]